MITFFVCSQNIGLSVLRHKVNEVSKYRNKSFLIVISVGFKADAQLCLYLQGSGQQEISL
jgi:hypothetical protein